VQEKKIRLAKHFIEQIEKRTKKSIFFKRILLNFKNLFNFFKEKEEKLSEKEQSAFVVRKLEEDLVKKFWIFL
jgi:hypothetical protein